MSETDNTTLDPAEAEAFRQRCTEFLNANATGMPEFRQETRGAETMAATRAFQKKAAEAGLAGLQYDPAYGGAGLTKAHQNIWRDLYARYPDMTGELTISHGMALPILNQFGTEEQKRQFMPRAISAEDVWCQMFSEPGAGSDVASLQTKAVRDGDTWVINGQKVWTTLAHHSEYGILIARTNPEVPKHSGISMFIVDMNAPGVEVVPIHQIDGNRHFNEVFFSDVSIPADWLVGELNNGWNQAIAMLMFERVAIGTGSKGGVSRPHSKRLVAEAQKRGTSTDPLVRQQLMDIYAHETAKSLGSMRTRAEMKAGKTPGPGGSLGKLHGAVIAKKMRQVIPAVVGDAVMAWSDEGDKQWSGSVLATYMSTIAGGTDEIQRNIIGDRVLGLPREPSVDKSVPFNELKVGTQT